MAPGLRFMGQPVCRDGLGTLLGIGGSRMKRLSNAASKGAEDCPLDGRLKKIKPRRKLQPNSPKRQAIYDFLMRLYVRHSEPAPEASSAGRQPQQKSLQFRRACRRGKRPRREIKKESSTSWTEETAKGLRMLPPGSYTDYLKWFRAENPHTTVSFKLFTRVFWHYYLCVCP